MSNLNNMENVGAQFLEKIQALREKTGGKIDVKDIDSIIEKFMEMIKGHVTTNSDVSLYHEISKIKENLKKLRDEMDNLNPYKIYKKGIPGATAELTEITKNTETATNIILDSTEKIQNIAMALENKESSQQICDLAMKIFEACNFQDLTSQRITKVLRVLDEFDHLLNSIINNFSFDKKEDGSAGSDGLIDRVKDNITLHGPQLQNNAPTQSTIDELFGSIDPKKK